MNFTATEQQVKEIALNAILASKVVGMGVLQDRYFKGIPLTTKDIEFNDNGDLFIDYFRGRMVKLNIYKEDENTWNIGDSVQLDYQSWGETYPTAEALVKSVVPDDIPDADRFDYLVEENE